MLNAKFMAPRVIEAVTAKESFTLREWGFSMFFCSRNLDLDLTTFIYERDPNSLEMYQISESKLLTSRLSKVVI